MQVSGGNIISHTILMAYDKKPEHQHSTLSQRLVADCPLGFYLGRIVPFWQNTHDRMATLHRGLFKGVYSRPYALGFCSYDRQKVSHGAKHPVCSSDHGHFEQCHPLFTHFNRTTGNWLWSCSSRECHDAYLDAHYCQSIHIR